MVIEEVAAFDWNLLITALTGLGGVAVGGFVTWKIQDRQLKHADESRFQEQRMSVYTGIHKSSNVIMAKYTVGNVEGVSVDLDQFYDFAGQAHLVSTKDTFEKVHEIIQLINSIQLKKGLMDDPEKAVKFRKALNDFLVSARKELKIDINV